MTDLKQFFKTILPLSPYYILTYTTTSTHALTGKPVTYMNNVVVTGREFDFRLEKLLGQNRPRKQDVHFATAGYNILGYEERIKDIETHISDERQRSIEIKKYMNSVRQAEFIDARKCLYIDIDRFKGTVPANGLNDHGKRVFADSEAMLGAVQKALETLAIPDPSYIVNTGGGIHLYWALITPVSNDEWRYMQMQMALMFYTNANIELDMQIAKNANGTMRVPTSYSNKREMYTTLEGEEWVYHTEEMVAFLDAKHPRSTVILPHAQTDNLFGNTPVPPHLQGHRENYSLTEWGFNDPIIPKWEDIVSPSGCQFARWGSTDGQAEVTNGQWVALLSWAKHCEGGDDLVHEISKNHPSYTEEETSYRAGSLDSVTSCQSSAQILNGKVLNPKCKGCPHLGKGNVPTIKNPLELSRRIQTSKEILASTDNETPTPLIKINTTPVESIGTEVPTKRVEIDAPLELDTDILTDTVVKKFMPQGYCILDPDKAPSYQDDSYSAGIGYTIIDPDLPDLVHTVRVTIGFVYVVDVIRDSLHSTLQYDFVVQQADNTLVSLRIGASDLASDEEVIKRFADVGVDYHLHSTKSKRVKVALFLDYIRQSVAKRHAMAEYTNSLKQYGWTSNKDAYLLGNWLIYGGTRRERAQPSSACMEFTNALTPKPTARVQRWAVSANMYNHAGMEAAQFIMGASLASPVLGLLRAVDAQGALINIYSLRSGAGKTSLARSALSIWGRPEVEGGHAGLTGISKDTQKSRIFTMSLFQNIPYYMDELTDLPAKNCYELVYQLTQGQDARRMKQSGVEAHASIGGWNMVAISSSNNSMIEKLYTHAGASADAVHARVLEFDVETMRSACDFMTNDDVRANLTSMHSDNYGIVGQDYLVRVVANRDKLVDEFVAIRAMLDKRFKFSTAERFWANTATLGIMGIRHGNEFGYFSYQEDAVIEWLAHALDSSRIERSESRTSIEEAIEQFISDKEPDSIIATTARSAVWATGIAREIPSYRNSLYESRFELHKHSFDLFVAERYKWTPKEVANMMKYKFGKTIRSRIRSGLGRNDVSDVMQQPRVEVWVVPHSVIPPVSTENNATKIGE